jgi:hypothetical protein
VTDVAMAVVDHLEHDRIEGCRQQFPHPCDPLQVGSGDSQGSMLTGAPD